ncbi:MAG TPA: quinolinate synthase NadA, partial [Candidatus Krumholzibacterium sp.]|nr:quinolinate synthase NadA [Candidatus Krumholzibacterium sp.]
MPREELVGRIEKLKDERGAVILAHNYQPAEIQDVADHLGDSLDLSRLAARLDAEVIVFCGVHFMAETASMLAPGKKVILPAPDAGCPMADMLGPEELLAMQAKHPGAVTVMYVNSTARVKALTDICCTSANVIQVIESIPGDREIIFGPDKYLGAWAAKLTGRTLHLCAGYCPSHQRIMPEEIRALREAHPDAEVMVHPEVNPSIAAEADILLGTGGMIRHAGESDRNEFIVGTEVGMTYRLSRIYPDKKFYPASPNAVCPNMKKITLEKLARSLETLEPVISVPEDIA